ncbi:MAG: ribose 5-phosphate isomerase B [Bacteroidales bacterium]
MFDKSLSLPIGSDHGGFEMKQFLIENLSAQGYKFEDFGTHSNESVDYPDFIHPVAKIVNSGEKRFGIIICGSGQGASMTANKYPYVRAGLCWDMEQAKLTRLHNNANIIALPGRFVDFKLAAEMVRVFLNTDFEGGRHIGRINKIAVNQ